LNFKAYIESGTLELFVMNLLTEVDREEVLRNLNVYPELGEELKRIENALELYAMQNSIAPNGQSKENVLTAITNLKKETAMDPANLPLINQYSDYTNWLKFVNSIGKPAIGSDGRAVQVLRHDEEVTQLLIVSSTDIEQEIHEKEHESFLILSGACKCTIGDRVRLMYAGDFMPIPLHEYHDVQVISPEVTAILQRVKV
jgi:mannose-6-phosphate isomerase-like protein (cupin superfamily)